MPDDVHESVLDRNLTLVLNKSWVCVGFLSVRKAIVSLMGGESDHPVMALDMEFNEDGTLSYANPVEWSVWENLPVRANDFYIQTSKGRIRAPTVVVTRNFNKIPMKKPRVSSKTIYERDGGVCQYSGIPVSKHRATLDHILPRSRGGKDTFTNLVLCDKDINMAKSDKTPEEAGLTLLRKPVAPPEIPVSVTIRYPNHPDWLPFLIR